MQARSATVRYIARRTEMARGRRVEIPALSDISFDLRHGESLGLVGHNGSGKSTLMGAIAGLVPLTAGEILVSSQPQLLGVNAVLSLHLTGEQNIDLCCLALGVAHSELADARATVAQFCELEDFLKLPLTSYSAGMRSRLSFSIAAMIRPEILLVDEALAVGDFAFKQKCFDRLDEIRDAAGTVILASHASSEIVRSCTRAIWLHRGSIRMDGDPEDVTAAYEEADEKAERKLEL